MAAGVGPSIVNFFQGIANDISRVNQENTGHETTPRVFSIAVRAVGIFGILGTLAATGNSLISKTFTADELVSVGLYLALARDACVIGQAMSDVSDVLEGNPNHSDSSISWGYTLFRAVIEPTEEKGANFFSRELLKDTWVVKPTAKLFGLV